MPLPTDLRPAIEDYGWQLHLAVLRARLALGLPPQAEAEGFLEDPRAIVRRAFASRLRHPPSARPTETEEASPLPATATTAPPPKSFAPPHTTGH